MSCSRDRAPTRLRVERSKLKSGAKVNVRAVDVGEAELGRGRGERGMKDMEREAEKFMREMERETGSIAMDGRG
jgi:hypothetical protein